MSALIPFNREEQNITELIDPKIQRYVDDYVMYFSKCTDAILSLAETCFEAKQNLTKSEFKTFVKQINLENKDSTISKYVKIGSVSMRFRKIEDRLPSKWTVLYVLACLDNATYASISPYISQEMTAEDVRHAIGKPNSSVPLVTPDMTINLSDKGTARMRKIYFELQELSIRYNFKIVLSKTFENEILNSNFKEVA